VIHEFVGSARERGYQHGHRLRRQIHTRIAGALPADADTRSALAASWLDAIDALDTSGPIGAELRGIADGARVPLPDVVLLNAFEAFNLADQVELGGCTGIALARPSGAIVAQNWDANPTLARSVGVHVHRGPDIPATVLLASPGGLGWIGMNAHGVALINNDLLTRGTRVGVPSQAVRRYALVGHTAAEAVAAIVSIPAVGGRAYLVGDATGALTTIELAAGAEPSITTHPGDAAHTNHALDERIAADEDLTLVTTTYPSSRARLDRARALLAEAPADLARVLGDHHAYPLSICRHPSDREPTVTAASVVFDCGRRHASITLGTACGAAPIEVDLSHQVRR
jgi:isopenicillin-N N-acyltransferase-like protein